jgi:hypothetical protein
MREHGCQRLNDRKVVDPLEVPSPLDRRGRTIAMLSAYPGQIE